MCSIFVDVFVRTWCLVWVLWDATGDEEGAGLSEDKGRYQVKAWWILNKWEAPLMLSVSSSSTFSWTSFAPVQTYERCWLYDVITLFYWWKCFMVPFLRKHFNGACLYVWMNEWILCYICVFLCLCMYVCNALLFSQWQVYRFVWISPREMCLNCPLDREIILLF